MINDKWDGVSASRSACVTSNICRGRKRLSGKKINAKFFARVPSYESRSIDAENESFSMKTNGILVACLMLSAGCTPAYVEMMQSENNLNEMGRYECNFHRADILYPGQGGMTMDFDKKRMTASGSRSVQLPMTDAEVAEVKKEYRLDGTFVYIRYPNFMANNYGGKQFQYEYRVVGDILYFGDNLPTIVSADSTTLSMISASSINLKTGDLKVRGSATFDGITIETEAFARCS